MYFMIFSNPLQLRKVYFPILQNIKTFQVKKFSFVSYSTAFKVMKSKLQLIICIFGIANFLKLDTFL
jgi:hypothetical protein